MVAAWAPLFSANFERNKNLFCTWADVARFELATRRGASATHSTNPSTRIMLTPWMFDVGKALHDDYCCRRLNSLNSDAFNEDRHRDPPPRRALKGRRNPHGGSFEWVALAILLESCQVWMTGTYRKHMLRINNMFNKKTWKIKTKRNLNKNKIKFVFHKMTKIVCY